MTTSDYLARGRELDRPLGRDRAPTRASAGGRTKAVLRAALGALPALAIVAVSTAVAMRERPFRVPVTSVVEEVAAADTPDASDARGPQVVRSQPAGAGGPAIIKVERGENPPSDGIVISDPSAVGQNLRVAHLPESGLVEDSPYGPLPVRAADGRRPMDVYARPWSGARGARVAIVVGGIGVSQTGSQYAVEALPAEVTLAFASGGNSLGRWMQSARQRGHEILMQVPLEPFDYPNVDPGRGTLTVDADAEENVDRLHQSLARITNYTGVLNYMGARLTADERTLDPVMAELARRGLLYLDDGSSARSLAPELAARNGGAHAIADLAIDGTRERGAILKKLDELERIARAKGTAIGTASAFDVTVDAVSGWIAEAKKRGIEVVPVSALVQDPERR
ncbi:MAG: divergent polysaccharide deacetylase family protein [Rhizobiaceae bacterium]